eukprot:340539-Chlamydomonas_euryale.AAC.3
MAIQKCVALVPHAALAPVPSCHTRTHFHTCTFTPTLLRPSTTGDGLHGGCQGDGAGHRQRRQQRLHKAGGCVVLRVTGARGRHRGGFGIGTRASVARSRRNGNPCAFLKRGVYERASSLSEVLQVCPPRLKVICLPDLFMLGYEMHS